MNGKQILALFLALAILLLLFMTLTKGADDTTDAKLIFDDPSLEPDTYAAMQFEDMENITKARLSAELNNLQEGNVWAFYQTQNGSDANDTQSIMIQLYYLNGMLYVYKYKSRQFINEESWSIGRRTYIYTRIIDTSTKETFIVGYAHNGQRLNISYRLTEFAGADISNTTLAADIEIIIEIGEYKWVYNTVNDNSEPITRGWAVTPDTDPSQFPNMSRGMMWGSFDNDNLGKSEFSLDNMTYTAYHFENITHNVTENWTAYYDHFFKSGEYIYDNESAYAYFEISSPARIYVLDAPISAPPAPIYINTNWNIDIESLFLENAWWIIPLLFGILIVDIWIDARDLHQDKKGGKS